MSGIGRSLAPYLASALLAAAPLPGDPQRGYAVVVRQSSTCTLCHAGPFLNPHLQGTVGPDLHGVGGRRTLDELRAQIVDASRFNPGTVMPSFGTVASTRVGAAWAGMPILTEQEIEDAAAYLATLR